MIRDLEKEAIEYIDIAIQKNSENPSYYSAKATIYDNRTDDLLDEYNAFMEKALEHKKIAFQNRNNPSKKAASQKLRDAELEKALVVLKQIEEDLAIADKLYQEALDIDPKFFNAAYNIGRIYVKHADRNLAHGEWLLKIYIKKDFTRSAKFEEVSKSLLKQAADKYEIAHNINKFDSDALNVLKQIYYKLHDTENRERVEELINNLTANESESEIN